ncbi:putative amino-acid metabolite efflux pump [Pseudovibrio axinellae]|uniref:Putative amino-acid metabolite efflux pump n=1 Tax=Pseudovibrio axinellae TaxID=989403 RepID=A0A165T5N1_9HYPH|nr:DMT family transporter [Pseudovibrio axinellae]KZL05469.1 putative amino-acid metabolite efflux pump [Pseudovibrio axinellae]SEP97947.1 EamA-like transporter family protein [Pseudovibrio axinellae]
MANANQIDSVGALAPSPHALSMFDYFLYAVTVFAWGFSWYALKLQAVIAPEVALFWRFLFATFLMWGWAKFGGHKIAFPLRAHLLFAALGFLLFSSNFLLFYHGSRELPSGLLSVIFSLASVFNIVLGFVLFRQKVSGAILLGALLGFLGICLMFYQEIAGSTWNIAALWGLGLCALGTLSFCFGNIVSSTATSQNISVISASAWGMVYGTVLLGVNGYLSGANFEVPFTPEFLLSLLYMVVVGSIIAFGAYLTLLSRIGSARAGYATVMFPIVALGVSTVMEGYVWTITSILGLLCALSGNWIVLSRSAKK